MKELTYGDETIYDSMVIKSIWYSLFTLYYDEIKKNEVSTAPVNGHGL